MKILRIRIVVVNLDIGLQSFSIGTEAAHENEPRLSLCLVVTAMVSNNRPPRWTK